MDQLRQVLRRLSRAPLFTAVTLITLAIGVGATVLIFGVVEGVLLKPLPYPRARQLIGVWHTAPGIGIKELNMAPSIYFIDREQSTTLQDIGVYDSDSFSVTGVGEPEHVHGLDVTDGTLPLLGVVPALGRLFTRQDDSPASPATVLLSYDYWRRRFGGDPAVIGRSITADGKSRQIIGVLPQGFQFLDDPDDLALFIPFQWDRNKTNLGDFSYVALARLKPGVTMEQASADMARLLPVAVRSFPPPEGFSVKLFENAHIAPNLRPLKQVVVGDVGNVLWVLMGSIVMVLLIACANVANLLLVRVEGRRQELAIRAALGAGRRRVAADLLLESVVLGLLGSLLGLAFAYGGLRVLLAMAPTSLPRIREIGIDVPVLLFTLALALVSSLLIGSIPVFKYAGARLNTSLREGGRALSQSRERRRARNALVILQVALALVLLICSGLMIRTFRALMHVPPGFAAPDTLQTFQLYVPETQLPDSERERLVRMEQAMLNKVAAIPGVSAVSFSSAIPMTGSTQSDLLVAQDRTYKEGALPPIRRFKFISPGFFATLGAPIIAGRDLTWTDIYRKTPVAIISENFAREYWHTAAGALSKRIRVGNTDDWREIIGVAGDVHDDGVNKPAPTSVYWPIMMDRFEGQKEMVHRHVALAIRSPRAGSQAFMKEIQQVVWSLDPNLPLANVHTLGYYYTKSIARTSFTLVILSVAGSMALLLGIVGIYGVISYSVSQRTREIGIRVTESLVIALAGGALALLVAQFGVDVVSKLPQAGDIPIQTDIQLDARALWFTLLVSLAAAILFGLAPALQATKSDLVPALKAGPSDQNRKRFFGRNALVTVQIAGSVVLLVAASQLYRGFGFLLSHNPGFRIDHRLTMSFDPSLIRYTPEQTTQFYKMLIQRAREMPGVKSAALSSSIPMNSWRGETVIPEGYQFPRGQESASVWASTVDDHYFPTLGITLLRGRGFQPTDRADSPRVAVVNELLAKHYLGKNPIGKRIRLAQPGSPWVEIVGVTPTGKYLQLFEPPLEYLYLPFSQNPRGQMSLIAEAYGDPTALAAPLREMVHSIDANVPIYGVRTMADIMDQRAVRLMHVLNGVVASIGLLGLGLALVGLYAVVAYQVARRTREIGIRMALGADRPQVMKMILKQASTMGLTGVAIGLALSYAGSRALSASVMATPGFDPVLFTLVPLGLLLTTLLAAMIPARRATRIDPMLALRQD